MRVSEFAKSAGLPSGIVLAQAKKMGLDVSTTLSSFDGDDVAKIKGWADGLSAADREALVSEYEASRRQRKARGDAGRAAADRKNLEAVEAHRQAAIDAEAGRPVAKPAPASAPEVVRKPVAEKPAAKPAEEKSAEKSAEKPAEKPAEAKPAEKPAEAKPAEKPAEAKPVEKPAEKPVQKPTLKPTLTPTAPKATLKPTLTPTLKPTLTPTKPNRSNRPAQSKPTLVGLTPTKPAAKPTLVGLAPTPRAGGRSDRSGRNDRNGAASAGEGRPERNGGRPDRNGRSDRSSRNGRNDRNSRNERNDRNSERNERSMRGRNDRRSNAPAASAPTAAVHGSTLQLHGPVTVKELAELLGTRPNLLIADLMKLNILASINQTLELGIVQKIADKYGFAIEMEERSKRSAERKPQLKSEDADDDIPEDKPEDMKLRPPVVTFLGHVDHGKTTLMDYIRKAHVASGEAGGITQHIAAYTIQLDQTDDDGNKRLITFVDTPGHSAFESMRARGANITDIAVIIVAADDGVMPQTREAIKHARNAGVQMLVAVTKCDKPDANTMRVYQMLQAEGLTPSAWGGDIECCEVSGVTGDGVEDLLETILIQADVLELQANPNRRANGAVIESQLEQGLGPTATFLVQGGTLHVGDVVLCGEHYGKVRTLIDERGKPVKQAGPSIAVKCTGLSGVPEAGSEFRVMLNEKRARELAEATAEENRLESLSAAQNSALADWTKMLGDDEKPELSIIVKGDTQGTSEAVVECLNEIKSEKVSLKMLYSGVGSVTAADVQRAKGAVIVGFGVNCEPGVQSAARQNGVRINTFRIIYELIEHVKRCMMDLIPPEYKEVVRGHAEIRQVFDISKLGLIAGCQMIDGALVFKGRYRIFRGKSQVYDGALFTMKHFKDDVREVTGSQECGLGFGSFEDFREGDIIECYEMEELPKSL